MSRAQMRSECARGAERTVDTIPFLVLLKSVLIFHRRGFYCTDSIHEKLRLTILFFKYKCSLRAQRRMGGHARVPTDGKRVLLLPWDGVLGAEEASDPRGATERFVFFL